MLVNIGRNWHSTTIGGTIHVVGSQPGSQFNYVPLRCSNSTSEGKIRKVHKDIYHRTSYNI